LTSEKNKLAELIKVKGLGTVAEVSILSQTMRRNMENENRDLTEEVSDQKLQINNLQSANL
jgi:hypothetical protein